MRPCCPSAYTKPHQTRQCPALKFPQCTGAIPPSLGQLTNLQVLWLNNNKLQGASVLSQFSKCLFEKRIARTGPPLPETLCLLAPLVPTLEKLDLGGNKLGGTITDDISSFTKLTELALYKMNLDGASRRITHPTPAEAN